MGVCAYLKALSVFDVARELGVEVDDRGIRGPRYSTRIILPLTKFQTTSDAVRISNDAFSRLNASDLPAANLGSIVTELFSELALNAAQHSDSSIGAFACIQSIASRGGARFVCIVADGGIGVRASLYRNEKLRARVSYDWDALELAVRERVSGTGDPHRGIGLYGVSEDVRQQGRSLLLHSGMGSLEIKEDLQSFAARTRLFPGTLAYVSMPA